MPTQTPISQVMTTKVRTVDVKDSLSTIRHIFAEGLFRHLPVLDGEDLVGIISSRDLVRIYRKISGPDSERIDERLDKTASIKDVMQTDLVVMRSVENVDRALDLLGYGDIHSVLIVDESEHLVGIVTNPDLLEYLFA